MAPSTIPIFPLPSVVLFPSVYLPLHIFEARYRQMVADALSGDRIIGMTLLKAGVEPDDPRPAVYDIGCAGAITHVERLADGRFNLVLRGTGKFRIVGEEDPPPGRLYRTALVEAIDEAVPDAEKVTLATVRQRLEARLAPLFERARAESFFPQSLSDADLVNTLAQYLEFDPIERQALLERPGPVARGRAMLELLDLRELLQKSGGDAGTVH